MDFLVDWRYSFWHHRGQVGSILDSNYLQLYDYHWSSIADVLSNKWLLHNGLLLVHLGAGSVLHYIELLLDSIFSFDCRVNCSFITFGFWYVCRSGLKCLYPNMKIEVHKCIEKIFEPQERPFSAVQTRVPRLRLGTQTYASNFGSVFRNGDFQHDFPHSTILS